MAEYGLLLSSLDPTNKDNDSLAICQNPETKNFFTCVDIRGISFGEESKEGFVRSRLQIFKRGVFYHTLYGKMEFTDEVFQMFLSNYKRRPNDICVDYDHASEFSMNTEARGWYQDLVINEQGFFADIDFYPDTAQKIREKRYKYYSPSFTMHFRGDSGVDQGPAVVGGGLTNRPFLRGMQAVTASIYVPKNYNGGRSNMNEFLIKLRELTGAKETDNVEEKAYLILKEQSDKIKTLSDEVSALKENVSTLSTERDSAKSRASELNVEVLKNKALSADEPKMTPALWDSWGKDQALKDPEGLEKYLAAAPPITTMSEKGSSYTPPVVDPTKTDKPDGDSEDDESPKNFSDKIADRLKGNERLGDLARQDPEGSRAFMESLWARASEDADN